VNLKPFDVVQRVRRPPGKGQPASRKPALRAAGAVYKTQARDHIYRETDPIDWVTDWLPTYAVGKIATEGVARSQAAVLGLPSVIARLSIAYGPSGHGGLPMMYLRKMVAGELIPIPPTGQSWCSLYLGDLVERVPAQWSAATVPATLINWGGDGMVGMTDGVRYLERLTGLTATFTRDEVVRTHINSTQRCEPLSPDRALSDGRNPCNGQSLPRFRGNIKTLSFPWWLCSSW
jgi:UDP-glucuronate 4-epimerase